MSDSAPHGPTPTHFRVGVRDNRIDHFEWLPTSAELFASNDPALSDSIRSALTGMPVSLPVEAIACRVRAAIPPNADAGNVWPLPLAIALRQQLTTPDDPNMIGNLSSDEIGSMTASWAELPWRIIFDQPRAVADNLAVDEALTESLIDNDSPPTLRFWLWQEAGVILGRSQSVGNEVDAELAERSGLTLGRRISGGGAMFVEPERVVTYSMTIPESVLVGVSIRSSYELCDAWAVLALRSIGVPAFYVPINDIATPAGKLAGAAQARRRGVVLHHTTMAIDLDSNAVGRLLRHGQAAPSDRGVRSAAKQISPLVKFSELSGDLVQQLLAAGFRAQYGGQVGELTEQELAVADKLRDEKYATDDWVNIVP